MIQKLYCGKTSFATNKNKRKDGTDPVYWFIRSLLLTDGAVWRESQVTIHYSHPRDWLAAARFSRVILVETNSANRSPNVWESSSAVGKTAVTTWVAQADDKRWPKPLFSERFRVPPWRKLINQPCKHAELIKKTGTPSIIFFQVKQKDVEFLHSKGVFVSTA